MIYQINELLEDFDATLRSVQELRVVGQWLRAVQVLQGDTSALTQNLDNKTMQELELLSLTLKGKMDLQEQTLDVLRFFLTSKSLLFEAITAKFSKSYKVATSLTKLFLMYFRSLTSILWRS